MGCSDFEARQTSNNTVTLRLQELRRRDIMFGDYRVSSVLFAERLLANNSWVVQGQSVLQKCPNGTFLEGKVSTLNNKPMHLGNVLRHVLFNPPNPLQSSRSS